MVGEGKRVSLVGNGVEVDFCLSTKEIASNSPEVGVLTCFEIVGEEHGRGIRGEKPS